MRKLIGIAALVLVAGCGKDETAPAPQPSRVISGELALDIRDTAQVSIELTGSSTQVTVTVSKGFGALPEGTAVSGAGTVEALPETDGVLYTARLSGPVLPGGACGNEPVSVGFTLHRDESNRRVSGGLAVYCGASTWHGKPVRMLRLSGSLDP